MEIKEDRPQKQKSLFGQADQQFSSLGESGLGMAGGETMYLGFSN